MVHYMLDIIYHSVSSCCVNFFLSLREEEEKLGLGAKSGKYG